MNEELLDLYREEMLRRLSYPTIMDDLLEELSAHVERTKTRFDSYPNGCPILSDDK